MGEHKKYQNDKGNQNEKTKIKASNAKNNLGDELLLKEFEQQERANDILKKKEKKRSSKTKTESDEST